ncbi:6-phospho-beta-glucosidase [Streptomyces sp. HNM0575]|uniref:family 4 glycosyl hydrolase n=1 Tax=Streptomyces sp. HNM0575 TaxID=2716338 RepID=UPI00145D015B|nr:6-phospho-beta-glucosidase [Streptomyces sp. HNM0575]NLU71441.1 6-phospho-beta-glucosidase [Streptomyces sp. HNM0575]
MRLAVAGGGSTYTPELIDGFARLRDTLPVSELTLIDPDTERLELVAGLARRIFAAQGHDATVTTTADPEAGVDGADAVLLQLRVGGQAARQLDETWPLECGCVGQETTGAGGLAKALRTVPVVLDIAERVRRTNPDAWIIDFTNPVGIVTRALLQAGHKALGLCNMAVNLQRKFAKLLDVMPEEIHLDHYGLNHLTWELGVRLGGPGGTDVLPKLLTEHVDGLALDVRMPRGVLETLGAFPSYYLRYYYAHDETVREMRGKPSRAEEVAAIERELLTMYGDPKLTEKPALLSRRGGAFYSEAAVALAAALLGGDAGGWTGDGTGDGADARRSGRGPGGARPSVQVVNLRNDGTMPYLPDDAVIEVPAEIGRDGAVALPVPAAGPLQTGLVAHVTAYEDLALDAALHGGRERVFKALLAHPLIGQYDRADALTDRLLASNREHLAWA